jgi:hypothetical protein
MKPVQIFTPENIDRVRAMRLAGVAPDEIAKAIGSKSAKAVSARCSQLGIFRRKRADVAVA